MKPIIYIFILSSIIGCKKFIKQEPYNNLPLTTVVSDIAGAKTILNACYENLRNVNYFLRDEMIFADITGGNLKYTRTANQILFYSYNFINTAVDNDNFNHYSHLYKQLYNCNVLLENYGKIKDANDLQKNRLRAEAYFFRAFAHFNLVNKYAQPYSYTADASHAGIYIANSTKVPNNTFNQLSTCNQVYNRIILDLDSAIILFNNSVPLFGTDKTWLSVNAIAALNARVNLYKGDYNKALAQVNIALGTNAYPLMTRAQYVNSWSKKNTSSENIFELAYGNRLGSSLGDYYNTNRSVSWQLAATNDLLNLFSTNDIRGTMFVNKTVGGINYLSPTKYIGTDDSANNIKIFRSSEMILIRAEALAQTNQLSQAYNDLNLIRLRANPSAPILSGTDLNVFMNQLFEERRRELCFEGHLFYDIARLKRNIVRTDCSAQNCNINFPNNKFALPIPLQ